MRVRTLSLLLALAASLALVATALASTPGLLENGTTQHLELTIPSQSLDVIAGHVTTEQTGPFGLTLGTQAATQGWVIIAPEHTPLPSTGTMEITEERPFEDPNGGTWRTLEVTIDGTSAWIAHVDEPRWEPTMGSSYNFAAIIDHSQIPDGTDLTLAYHATLPYDLLDA